LAQGVLLFAGERLVALSNTLTTCEEGPQHTDRNATEGEATPTDVDATEGEATPTDVDATEGEATPTDVAAAEAAETASGIVFTTLIFFVT
jgi:hypothetical protein